MGLAAKFADVPEHLIQIGSTGVTTRTVHGVGSSLMVATRQPGYHSRPHIHDCEQLNYVQSGEVWIYVGDRGYHLRTGDFHRVPHMAIHWAWNRGSEPCTLVEVHTPGLQADPLQGGDVVPLFDDGEPIVTTGSPRNIFVDPELYPPDHAEAQSD